MRLPGTRYQEHGWEEVRKLLGRSFLHAFAQADPAALLGGDPDGSQRALYLELVAAQLHLAARGARGQASGNSYGDSVAELALSLLFELQERPADWTAFCAAIAGEHARMGPFWRNAAGEALLRKKVNDMFAVLRDKVDADNYQAACGRPCSANRIYGYRMLDTAYGDIARLFANWEAHRAQVGAILGREVQAMPIEVRQMSSIAACRPEWVMRWSESLERFGAGPGPLHTRSKRFASLKDNPERIAQMMAEIGDYEELSANRDQEWLADADTASEWMEDLWRVLEAPLGEGPDEILPASDADDDNGPPPSPDDGTDDERGVARSLSLPPRFLQLARAAQEPDSWTGRVLAPESMPVRLAVYLKMLGPDDDSYPADWRDPASGQLPTMAQLATLDGLSLPTLRKRRDAAIARLLAAVPHKETKR